ncbi:unnamed protein product [Vitrella brassicaformis CCMP3155]|uniref:Uncharacterized protein n=2 Tax=Vitrella brassicaformis TaxID=1169539 RepID=A0A0G4FJ64_VITBC|nr:unnamed protein product [Vitrella brassicaformis CCMP3155]|eukprot:CEM13771.1 unnamed protein product [Vitrella brassicaformis CCMP3155]
MAAVSTSRTEEFRKAVNKSEGQEGDQANRLVDLLKEWDTTGKGTFSPEDVCTAARQVLRERSANNRLRWAVFLLVLGYIATAGIMLGLVVAGVGIMKDTSVSANGTLTAAHREGIKIRVQEDLERWLLPDLMGVGLEEFDKLTALIIPHASDTQGLYYIASVVSSPDKYTFNLHDGSTLVASEDGYTLTDGKGDNVVSVTYEPDTNRQLQVQRRRRRYTVRGTVRGRKRTDRCGPYPCITAIGGRPYYRPIARPFPRYAYT